MLGMKHFFHIWLTSFDLIKADLNELFTLWDLDYTQNICTFSQAHLFSFYREVYGLYNKPKGEGNWSGGSRISGHSKPYCCNSKFFNQHLFKKYVDTWDDGCAPVIIVVICWQMGCNYSICNSITHALHWHLWFIEKERGWGRCISLFLKQSSTKRNPRGSLFK